MEYIIHQVHVTESTQDDLHALAKSGAASGTIVSAERQTSGRGREGRLWESPAGNLHFSLLIRDPDMPEHLSGEGAAARLVPLIAGLAVADLADPYGVAQIKWPNDVMVGGRKLAGILCEHRDGCFLIGVGINVLAVPIDTAVCLADLPGPAARDRRTLPPAAQILERWTTLFSSRMRRTDAVAEVQSRLYGRNRPAIHLGNSVIILGLTQDGFLEVRTPDGRKVAVKSGDVTPGDFRPETPAA